MKNNGSDEMEEGLGNEEKHNFRVRVSVDGE